VAEAGLPGRVRRAPPGSSRDASLGPKPDIYWYARSGAWLGSMNRSCIQRDAQRRPPPERRSSRAIARTSPFSFSCRRGAVAVDGPRVPVSPALVGGRSSSLPGSKNRRSAVAHASVIVFSPRSQISALRRVASTRPVSARCRPVLRGTAARVRRRFRQTNYRQL
jgi:hypothetical protein